ncbi:MAG: flagellar hook-length control protein FliK [Nitrospiraceae bacterium]|nr:flagellar hook-length control protein FliK [Nitrospiraceae bacterium]
MKRNAGAGGPQAAGGPGRGTGKDKAGKKFEETVSEIMMSAAAQTQTAPSPAPAPTTDGLTSSNGQISADNQVSTNGQTSPNAPGSTGKDKASGAQTFLANADVLLKGSASGPDAPALADSQAIAPTSQVSSLVSELSGHGTASEKTAASAAAPASVDNGGADTAGPGQKQKAAGISISGGLRPDNKAAGSALAGGAANETVSGQGEKPSSPMPPAVPPSGGDRQKEIPSQDTGDTKNDPAAKVKPADKTAALDNIGPDGLAGAIGLAALLPDVSGQQTDGSGKGQMQAAPDATPQSTVGAGKSAGNPVPTGKNSVPAKGEIIQGGGAGAAPQKIDAPGGGAPMSAGNPADNATTGGGGATNANGNIQADKTVQAGQQSGKLINQSGQTGREGGQGQAGTGQGGSGQGQSGVQVNYSDQSAKQSAAHSVGPLAGQHGGRGDQPATGKVAGQAGFQTQTQLASQSGSQLASHAGSQSASFNSGLQGGVLQSGAAPRGGASAPQGQSASQPAPHAAPVKAGADDTFVVTRQDAKTIEVRIEPEGLGKMDIRLFIDKGHVNAHINASESIGKEVIEGNLHNIMSKLAGDGINVGSFSVSLRNGKREGWEGPEKDGGTPAVEKTGPAEPQGQPAINAPSGHGGAGTISLFA